MEHLRLISLCISTAGAIMIIFPLFILPSTYWDSPSPYFSSVYQFKELLQDSALLLHAHILILGSVLSLTIEFCLDFFSGNSETISIAQIRERAAVLASHGAVTIAFLSCRSLNSITAIYVGANCARTCFASGMIYYAVFPELQSKLDKITLNSLSMTVVLWEIVKVIEAYEFYFNKYSSANQWIGLLSLFILVYCISCWLKRIAKRQNSSWVKFNDLTTDEYAAMSYIVPLFIQPVFSFTYCVIASGSYSWLARSETTLIVQLGSLYVLLLIVILVPGRILHMLAVANMALLRLKQIFVRYVSHEIRSPLNIVHAGLDLLQLTIKAADPTSPFVSIDRSTADFVFQMFFASESAINILNDLLQYEHIESGTFALTLTAVCVAGSFHKKLGWATMLASQKSIIFSVIDSTLASEFGLTDSSSSVIDGDIESGDILFAGSALTAQRDAFLHVDIHRLDQVIRNLITNAVKFTPSNGRVTLTISCTLLENDNSSSIKDKFGSDAVGVFRVAVTDSGVGLSPDEQKSIFGEFTQFNKNNLQGGGGSGLGLWISRRIIQMHKGFMAVTSDGRGHGSTFYFELPLFGPGHFDVMPPNSQQLQEPSRSIEGSRHPHLDRAADLQVGNNNDDDDDDDDVLASPPNAANEDTDTPAKISGPLCFLIVDDSPMNLKVLTRLIESEKEGLFANAVILTADDGTTAIETLQQQTSAGRQVHFVLMDSTMTNLHGPDAAWIMRDEMGFYRPIIGVTGNALPTDIELFISKGADEVIIKPLTKAKLMQVLEKYVSAEDIRATDRNKATRTGRRTMVVGVLPVTCNKSSGSDIE